jgi:SurA N-terminal domain
MKKHLITLITLVLLVSHFMLPGCRKSESERAKTAPEAHQKEMVKRSFEESKKVISAKVNGEPIAMFSVLREMNAIAPQYLAVGQPATPELNAKIRKDALNTLITQELAVQEARKRGMKVKPEAIDSEIMKIKGDKGSEAGYQGYLGSQGITENELRKAIEQDTLFEMIAAQEIDAKVMVTDAALRERYKKGKAGLKDAAHRQITFEAAKGLLEQRLRAEAVDKRMRDWAEELRKNARIEIIEQKPK